MQTLKKKKERSLFSDVPQRHKSTLSAWPLFPESKTVTLNLVLGKTNIFLLPKRLSVRPAATRKPLVTVSPSMMHGRSLCGQTLRSHPIAMCLSESKGKRGKWNPAKNWGSWSIGLTLRNLELSDLKTVTIY